MSTEWGHPINALEYQLKKAEEMLESTGGNLKAAQAAHDAQIERRDAHAAALRVLKAAAEAEGRDVEYSPADGQQEARKQEPRNLRKGQRVKYATGKGWLPAGVEGVIEQRVVGTDQYAVRFTEQGTVVIPRDDLELSQPPYNSAGVPLIVGNKYTLHRPDNKAQDGRTVKLRERHTIDDGIWHIEFVESKTDGYAKADELG